MFSLAFNECQSRESTRSSRLIVALVVAVATVSMATGSVPPEVGRLDDTAPNSDSPTSAVELVVGGSRGIHVDDADLDDEMMVSDEKRKSGRFTAFRSDLGKRRPDPDDEQHDDVIKRSLPAEDFKRAVYRMRGGKAFKADLGKRPALSGRGATLFRSDLGRRSVPVGVSDLDDYDDDDVITDTDPEVDVERRAMSRGSSMFRSDLGKRAQAVAPVRRMFRADLGKRARARVPFRHDLG